MKTEPIAMEPKAEAPPDHDAYRSELDRSLRHEHQQSLRFLKSLLYCALAGVILFLLMTSLTAYVVLWILFAQMSWVGDAVPVITAAPSRTGATVEVQDGGRVFSRVVEQRARARFDPWEHAADSPLPSARAEFD